MRPPAQIAGRDFSGLFSLLLSFAPKESRLKCKNHKFTPKIFNFVKIDFDKTSKEVLFMQVNAVKNWSNNSITTKKSSNEVGAEFSRVLDNLKHGRPADYDEEKMRGQKTQTMTQILSDGSTLVTVYDENGKMISQSKTKAANPDPNAHVIGTRLENNFGLEELAANGNINVALTIN